MKVFPPRRGETFDFSTVRYDLERYPNYPKFDEILCLCYRNFVTKMELGRKDRIQKPTQRSQAEGNFLISA